MIEGKGAIVNLLISVVVSAFVSGLMTFGFEDWNNQRDVARNSRVSTALQFANEESDLILLAGDYMQAVAKGSNIDEIRISIRKEIGKQFRSSDNLRPLFSNSTDLKIDAYQNALDKFQAEVDEEKTALTMRPWVEIFGVLYDSRRDLGDAMSRELGLAS